MIVLAGTIGAGKSSLTEMMAEHFGSRAFYESIEDNEVLPLFYANPEQYAFLLQIYCSIAIIVTFVNMGGSFSYISMYPFFSNVFNIAKLTSAKFCKSTLDT